MDKLHSFLILVLYSKQYAKWKIADFGLTMEGHSALERTTICGRGTPGYRAPELLLLNYQPSGIEYSQFSKKSDIWALGCVLYEPLFARSPFVSDFALRYHLMSAQTLNIPTLGHLAPYSGTTVMRLLLAMVDRVPERPPSAKALRENFSFMFQLSSIICEAEPFDLEYDTSTTFVRGRCQVPGPKAT
jgi:serine/threonine protein kinase